MALIHQPIPLDAQWLDPLCELLRRDIDVQSSPYEIDEATATWEDQRAVIDKLVSLSPSVALMLCHSHVALPWEHLLWLLQHRDVDTDIRNVYTGVSYRYDEKLWTLLSHPRVQSSVVKLGGKIYSDCIAVRDTTNLAPMTSLKSLTFRVDGRNNLSKHGLSFLSSLPRLTCLCIGNELEDDAFEGLAGSLTALKHLHLRTRSARFLDDVPSLKTSLTRLDGDWPAEALQSCLGLQYINIRSDHPCFNAPNPFSVFPALCTAKTISIQNYSQATRSPLEPLLAPRVPLAVKALCIYRGSLTRDALAGFPCLASLTYLKLWGVEVEPGHETALTNLSALTALKRLTIEGGHSDTMLRCIRAPLRELKVRGGASCSELVQACPIPLPFAPTLTRLELVATESENLGTDELDSESDEVPTRASSTLLAQLTALKDVCIETENLPLLPVSTSSRLTSLRVLYQLSTTTLALAEMTILNQCCGRLIRLELGGPEDDDSERLSFYVSPDAYRAIPSLLAACTRLESADLKLHINFWGVGMDVMRIGEARASEFGSMPQSWREALNGLRFIKRFEAIVGLYTDSNLPWPEWISWSESLSFPDRE